MSRSARLKLAHRLGHEFASEGLLEEALTHASAKKKSDNERLEFLGDRVLGLIVADHLRLAYPEEGEGAWAHRLAVLTSRKVCADIAAKYNMPGAMIMDDKNRESVLSSNVRANLCEAVIAALYLDGGLDVARTFVLTAWRDEFDAHIVAPVSDKQALQEFTLAQGLGLPVYSKLAQTGPDHAPEITVRVSLDDARCAEASAGSRKEAEHKAAQMLLEMLKA